MTDINMTDDLNRMHEIQDVKQTGCGMMLAQVSGLAVASAGVVVFTYFLVREVLEYLWAR